MRKHSKPGPRPHLYLLRDLAQTLATLHKPSAIPTSSSKLCSALLWPFTALRVISQSWELPLCHATTYAALLTPHITFSSALHTHGTALGTPPGLLGTSPHLLYCPLLHGLHACLSSHQYLRLSLLHCPSCRNLLHCPPCSVPCTALCLCPAHSCPTVALKPWHYLQCPHAPSLTSHTLHSSTSLPLHAGTPTARTAPRGTVQAFSGAAPSGGGDLGKSCIICPRAPDGPVAPQSRGPSPQSLSPPLLGSEPCSVFAHPPQFSLPFVLILCLSHLTTAALPLG